MILDPKRTKNRARNSYLHVSGPATEKAYPPMPPPCVATADFLVTLPTPPTATYSRRLTPTVEGAPPPAPPTTPPLLPPPPPLILPLPAPLPLPPAPPLMPGIASPQAPLELALLGAVIIPTPAFPPVMASDSRFSSEVISTESTAAKEGKRASRASRL